MYARHCASGKLSTGADTGGDTRASRKRADSSTQLISRELFYVPGMVLGPGGAGLNWAQSLPSSSLQGLAGEAGGPYEGG